MSNQSSVMLVGRRLNYCGEEGDDEYIYSFRTMQEAREFIRKIGSITEDMDIQWTSHEAWIMSVNMAVDDMFYRTKDES